VTDEQAKLRNLTDSVDSWILSSCNELKSQRYQWSKKGKVVHTVTGVGRYFSKRGGALGDFC